MIFMRLYVLYYPMTHFEVMVYFAFPTMFANSVAHCLLKRFDESVIVCWLDPTDSHSFTCTGM